MSHQWFTLPPEQVLSELKTSADGLTAQEAEQRLKQHGPNALPESRSDTFLTIFIRQFQSPLIYVLLASSIAIFLLGETTDALIILFVLFFNATIGTIQEGKAQNTLRALKRLAKTTCTVIRDGQELVIADEQLVPGDIILLTEGQRVPADARLLEVYNLAIDEAALTGEAFPVHKEVELPKGQKLLTTDSVPTGDQKTLAFKGTFVTTGRGKAIVVATGSATKLGKIARSIEQINTDIPLKRSLERLTHQLVWAIGGISLLIFCLGLLADYPVREMFATVISLAVSAIPEGLPIVLTLVLATGVWRMSKRNALVKKLEAVEALGQATIIAVDKTGTITQNELTVTSLYVDSVCYTVTGDGYKPTGQILKGKTAITIAQAPAALIQAAEFAALNATAQLKQDATNQRWQVIGDPTEAALRVFSAKLGINREQLLKTGDIIAEAPFDYERKYRATIYRQGKSSLLTVSGAPEKVMALCGLDKKEQKTLEATLTKFLKEGKRVVAFASSKSTAQEINHEQLKDLAFGGFFIMQDVLHPEIRQTIEQIQQIDLKVVMITGDHQVAAEAIAREAGIFRTGDIVMTGQELATLSPKELARKIDRVTVFARVTPEDKQQIIQAYRLRGELVAMTGDGVNDAPSLVAADLGLAMGISGTEVAKEAADIVLLDDNLKSIVAAIEEGRNIYKTIKRVISYLLSTSAGEILVIGGALLLGQPLPVTAAQIIWLNLVTDGFLDVSLAMEPKSQNLLKETWNNEAKSLMDQLIIKRIALFAIVMAIGTLWLLALYDGADAIRVSSIALVVMAAFQWFNAWNSRSRFRSIFSLNPLTNPYLIAATVTVIGLQILALYLPFFQGILNTQPLSLNDWLIAIAVGSLALWAEEARKLFARRQLRRQLP